MNSKELEDLEIELLLTVIYRHYGFDFRDYAQASLKRRVYRQVNEEKLNTISELCAKLLHNPQTMERLLKGLSINVTSMFRDPHFYVSFRDKVIPLLRTYPFFRIWHAGCSTGEEVYSMAILLHEAGLFDRCRIYGTDINQNVLEVAKSGVIPLDRMKLYTQNYIQAGGTKSFSEYYTALYDGALLSQELRQNIIFAQHNLVSDASFNEFDVIVCRNVMIYFNKDLQNSVHKLFYESLSPSGILALGSKETIKFSEFEDFYKVVDNQEKIYKRNR
jgi:chemotaxis protein methyltransferase CheR